MMLIEETAVPDAALPVAQFKAHLRLGTGFADDDVQDAVLQSFLRAAIASIEARTGKVLIERVFSWELLAWRTSYGQALPVAPVKAVEQIVLRHASGSEQIADPAHYRLERDTHRPRIVPLGTVLPPVPSGGAVVVRFRAGFGTGWGDLPADLGQAVLLLAAHYYEYRADTALGGGCMPFGVTSLIERYRTVRLLGGGAA
ncbi:head-tail connector protein [Roseovarius aquimarinus]|uniref:Phage head-tail connector protein n=1 Tax=Roseovarius aquimarinus TaxID=1229156 RepID=A0ABW7I8W8_9RHOB